MEEERLLGRAEVDLDVHGVLYVYRGISGRGGDGAIGGEAVFLSIEGREGAWRRQGGREGGYGEGWMHR